MRISIGLLAAVLCLCSGCGCGNRSLPVGDGDAGTDGGLPDGGPRDGPRDGPRGDGAVPPSCDAQDARQGDTVCGLFLGYAWNGDDCIAISCSCAGADCGALYDTYGACLSDHAGCLPPTGCDDLDPSECARLDYTCATGWVAFDNECGCGCRLP